MEGPATSVFSLKEVTTVNISVTLYTMEGYILSDGACILPYVIIAKLWQAPPPPKSQVLINQKAYSTAELEK